MADSTAFQVVSEALEETSALSRLESRGTVRLTLRSAGLDSQDVTASQMRVVLEKVLPDELSRRGIDGAPALCHRIAERISGLRDEDDGTAPDAVFARLGGA